MKVAALLLVFFFIGSSFGEYRNVCYLGGWSVYRWGPAKYTIEDVDPTLCTHIIYSFVGITSEGDIRVLDPWGEIGDEWKEGAFTKLQKLKAKSPETLIYIAIGGWNEGSESYSRVMKDSTLRRNFVNNAVKFVQQYKFDGFDLDWEYPTQRGGSPVDHDSFTKLVKELSARLRPLGLGISAAVSANCDVIPTAYDVPKISQYLDFINIMAYDLHGSWEKVTGHHAALRPYRGDTPSERCLNVECAVKCWIANGATPGKLNMGIGTYGRSFTLADKSKFGMKAPTTAPGQAGKYVGEDGFLAYNEICVTESEWKIIRDPDTLSPYAAKGNTWVGYDDPESVALKVEFLKSQGLGGAMVWSIETDDFRGDCGKGKYPILNAIVSTLGGIGGQPAPNPPTPEPETPGPEPGLPGPEPELPGPEPEAPAPEPERPAPEPEAPAPEPERPAPEPEAPAPEPERPAPEPERPAPKPETPTPEAEKPNTPECSYVGQMIRDPKDCSAFYTCGYKIGKSQTMTRNKCAPGTLYDPNISNCNHAYAVQC